MIIPRIHKYTIFCLFGILPLLSLLPNCSYGISEAKNLNLPVFPGAEGFGCCTVAGSGRHITPSETQVCKVTNLNDSGVGSLRDAIDGEGPRTVVFEVAGSISLKKKLLIKNPYITIAGHTAPSPGITINNYGLIVEDTHDVLIQHLAIRIGDLNKGIIDGMSINSGKLPTYNIVVDHVSVSWWQDGGIDFYKSSSLDSELRDITVSNCIISEGLMFNNHALATVVGPGSKNIAFIKNLWAHNQSRNPLIEGNTSVLLINNLVYNSVFYGTVLTNSKANAPHIVNIQGSVVIPGPDTKNASHGLRILSNVSSLSRIFSADLLALNNTGQWAGIRNDTNNEQIHVLAPPINSSPLSVLPSAQAIPWVLNNVGSRPWDRDQVDQRVVKDVENKTGRIIDSQDDVGGWPVVTPKKVGLTIPINPNHDDNGDGYTNLEEWLHRYLLLGVKRSAAEYSEKR